MDLALKAILHNIDLSEQGSLSIEQLNIDSLFDM